MAAEEGSRCPGFGSRAVSLEVLLTLSGAPRKQRACSQLDCGWRWRETWSSSPAGSSAQEGDLPASP